MLSFIEDYEVWIKTDFLEKVQLDSPTIHYCMRAGFSEKEEDHGEEDVHPHRGLM